MPNQIDNDIYNRIPEEWWSKKGFLNILQSATNPWRVPYFRRILAEIKIDPQQKKALEVGCGGGLLTEEIAKMGFTTTGLDVSLPSLEVAHRHAKENGLEIDYQHGFGDKLPFTDASFDAVFCCDTLEHITNWDETVREISRVLKPGGVFFYNTVNRTSESMKNTIKMMQEWWPTRFAPPNTHVWEMFITPEELRASIESNGLIPKGLRGTKFIGTAFQVFSAILLYKFGMIASADFGSRIQAVEGDDISVNYMGYAVKP
jgi:2-polyprenyl-6-hydroxyphenyl methylase/3-demethylubiquinone-9 3-methyltransferase